MFDRPLLFLGIYFVLIGIVKLVYVFVTKDRDADLEDTREIDGE